MTSHFHLDHAQDKLRGMILHKDDGEKRLLWGLLHVKIIRCTKLRNLDGMNVKKLVMKRKKDLSDPYVTAHLDKYRLLKTRHIDDDLNPYYNEEFYCPVAHVAEGVTFMVMDRDVYTQDDLIGKYTLPASELIARVGDGDAGGRPGDLKRVGLHKNVFLGKKKHGSIEFFIEFIPTCMLHKTMEVPGVYFQKTNHNDVKLYVNADDDGSAPIVKYGGPNDDDKVYTPGRLWVDIYNTVSRAKHFLYVAGWSVDTDQYLLRGEELKKALAEGKYSPQIGELLKAKANEGVTVNVMQWDDQSSNFLMPGMMGTYDEKTRLFFKASKVKCRLCAMTGGDVNSVAEGVSKKMAFTHHQKYIICDVPKEDGTGRELHAFVGGVDLTEGRWDNRRAPLFRSLQSEHKGDNYTKCFNLTPECGPRQPWHDIHSAVRGPEAIDLAQAFEERWSKQCDAADLVNRNSLGFDSKKALENKGGWCTQLSRSIDSRVDEFDPTAQMKHRGNVSQHAVDEKLWKTVKEKDAAVSKRFETATATQLHYGSCLDQKKGRLVDNSIHLHNIHHIRRAEHFIYIESQYFMGSSFMWSKDDGAKCGNLLAAELTYKICEKIAAREPFAVYILLPMWMEGIPQAGPTQALLYYQRLTIEAMYKKVQEALVTRMANSADHGLKATDFLNFYCLGTRETAEGSQATSPPKTDDDIILTKTRRHQIYVHSKMMIVDDNVSLIGTANINQRSMDGCRDSEIMMTAWQTDHLATPETMPKGDIHAFRLHAWAAITGRMDDVFRRPSSIECVHAMNDIADKNWKQYMAKETTDMTSHLLPFPLEWDGTEIRPRTGLVHGDLPDTKASAMGKKSALFPELMLT